MFMMVSLAIAENGAACPTRCSCTVLDNYFNSSSVKCSYLDLSDIPAMLDVTKLNMLDLSFNRISILRNASFSNFSGLSTLTLSYNEIEEIEINTFTGLRMMRDLDLKYNNLKSFNPEIFSANPKLEKVSLQGNPIAFLSSDSPIITSASVSILDLSHCSLTAVHPVTFSGLPSLYSLDLSSNLLQTISVTAFEKLPKLMVLKLNNNRWTCNCSILELMQWLTVRREQSPAHRPVKCLEGQTYRKFWTRAGGSQSCSVSTTTEALIGREGEFTTDVTVDLPTVSVGIPQSLNPIPRKTSHRDEQMVITSEARLRTTPESETGSLDSVLSWNNNTMLVFVILPITLGIAVFVSLIAVNYIMKRGKDHRTQHHIQGKDNHNADLFSQVPLVNPQLTADHSKQHAGCVIRSSCGVGGAEYHVYERLD
jgi:hypothetical protein